MSDTSAVVPIVLPNGSKIRIEARTLDGSGTREQVGIRDLPFTELIPSIEGISEAVLAAVSKVSPTKASVEFGIEVSVEAGKLVALLCSGATKANLRITLEWGPDKK